MHSQLLHAPSTSQMPQPHWLLKLWYLVYALIAKQTRSKRGSTKAKEATSLPGGTDLNLFPPQTEAGTWNNVTSPLASDIWGWMSPNNVSYRTRKMLKNSERQLIYSTMSQFHPSWKRHMFIQSGKVDTRTHLNKCTPKSQALLIWIELSFPYPSWMFDHTTQPWFLQLSLASWCLHGCSPTKVENPDFKPFSFSLQLQLYATH